VAVSCLLARKEDPEIGECSSIGHAGAARGCAARCLVMGFLAFEKGKNRHDGFRVGICAAPQRADIQRGCRHLSPGPTAWHPDGKRISSVQDWTMGERGSSNSVLLKIGQKESVDNVHTLAFGLGRTSAGLARTRHVFGTSQRLQGLECSSSPTSGTVFPQVRGPLGL
jgi:hypothetical protein